MTVRQSTPEESMEPLKFGVVGIGGFARTHLRCISQLESDGTGILSAAVVRNRAKYRAQLEQLEGSEVEIFQDLPSMLKDGDMDIVTIPTGIQFHVPQTVSCLRAGYPVICEKPMAATIQEADRMLEAQKESGLPVIVGYQAIFTNAIQTIKKRLLGSPLGGPRTVRIKGGWPRDDVYYSRNRWAGRLKVGEDWILDSPINNAFAHEVNNALFLSGPSQHESAVPRTVQAEFYRARNIESLDTACLRILTSEGTEILIALSHATEENFDPCIVIQAENGSVTWTQGNGHTTIEYDNGHTEEFDNFGVDAHLLPFQNGVETVLSKTEALCTPANARTQTLCINGAHESCPAITTIPPNKVKSVSRPQADGTTKNYQVAEGVDDLIHRCYVEGGLFSELGAEWGHSGEIFDLTDYASFPKGKGPKIKGADA